MLRRWNVRTNFSLPLAVLAALVIALLLFVSMLLVSEFDRAAQLREEMVVRQGVGSRVHEIAITVLPQVMWDDAVQNLDNRFNRQWATENIGTYLNKTGGFDYAFVLDRSDLPIFAASNGLTVASSKYADFRDAFLPLVAKIRRAEVRRGPLPSKPPKNGVLAEPIQESSIAAINGDIFVVVGTLVAPDFGRAHPIGPRAPMVMSVMKVDQQFLDGIANRFLLEGVHLDRGDSKFERNEAHAPMLDANGHYVATLDWIPEKPGRQLFSRLGTPIFTMVALLLLAIVLFYVRSRRMARGLIASEARATHLAYHDPLTGLPNRALFLDRLEHALCQLHRKESTVVVHCLDLDNFKEVNDTLGHLVGDELIRAAANRMASHCRSSETFARLSGDEFAIIQTDVTMADAAALAARLCDIMVEPFEVGPGRVFVGCSIGISCAPGRDVDAVELYRQADLALYRAKAIARGQFCIFEMEMDSAVKTRRLLESDLRDALAAGQLDLAYQPQVDGRAMICGVEALVRWRHPVQGDISPAFFVPIAEQSGLILTLGLFTLRRAFEDSRRWKGLKMAINISANQIRTKDFVSEVARLVAEADVDPAGFELEITEGVLLRDDPETHDTLRALRTMGFALVLDDFGTGYSSLSYLRRYPISKIKIDRSFVTSLGTNAESTDVVNAIVRLARALNLAIIAEGVETIAQWACLRSVGCADAQGYLFGKAVAAGDLDELWRMPNRVLLAAE